MTAGVRGRSFDRVAHCYDETRGLPDTVRAAVVEGIAAALRDVAPGPRLLEVGVGTGRIAIPLSRAGVRVVGVDIAPAMLARLRGRDPHLPVCRADGTQLPFRPAPFDAALFVHVLHLVPGPTEVVSAARVLIRPGGLLLLGREDFGHDPLRPVSAMVREIVAELTGEEHDPGAARARAAAAFAAAAGAAGAVLEETVLARWIGSMSGRRLLECIAGHVFSSTWDIPDAVMPELIRRLTPRVEALVGDLDRPLARESVFTLVGARLR